MSNVSFQSKFPVKPRSVILATMAHLAWRGAFVISGMLIFRLRSADDFAIFQFFNITAVGMASYASLGLGQAATRYFASSDGCIRMNHRGHAALILLVGFVMSLVAATVAYALGDLMLGHAADFRSQFSVLAAVYLFAGIVDGGMVGLGRFGWLLASNLVGAGALLCGFALYADKLSLSKVVWLFCFTPAASMVMNASVLLSVVVKSFPQPLGVLDLKKVIWDVFGFSLPLFGTGFIFISVPWLYGRLLQGSPELLASFARFSIGLQWFSLVLLVPSMVTRVVAPHVFSEVDDGRGARDLLFKRSAFNAGIAAIVAAILILLSETVLKLYGGQADSARADLIVMTIAAVFASTIGVIGTYVMAVRGASRWLALMFVWGLCAAGALIIMLKIGVDVFSYGYLVAYIVLSGLAWWNISMLPARSS